ncbi:MAG: MBL fold metallo-hydrolase [Pseudomonadota bacterium]
MSIAFIADPDTKAPGIYNPQPGLIRVVAGNAGPFTYTGTGTYILNTSERCVVIDPGPQSESHVKTIIEAIGNRSVDAILVTHTHRDHSPASRALKDHFSAPILGCAPVISQTQEAGTAMDESQDMAYNPDRQLKNGERLQVGGYNIEVFATPGHLANHLCYRWIEHNALFSGDHIMGWATSVVIPPDGHMASYMESLERTLELDLDTIWPTHGQPITVPQPFIKALIAHRKARESAILQQIRSGNGSIMDIVATLYHDVPKALHPAAAQSVFAHIIHLIEQGLAKPRSALSINDFFDISSA